MPQPPLNGSEPQSVLAGGSAGALSRSGVLHANGLCQSSIPQRDIPYCVDRSSHA